MDRREIVALLPEVMQAVDQPASPMHGLIDAMVHLLDPTDRMLDSTHELFDPVTARLPFLAMLATWLSFGAVASAITALIEDDEVAQARLSRLVFEAPRLLHGRGTHRGLQQLLTIVAGAEVSITEAEDLAFHMIVECDALASADRSLVGCIVALERPIYVTCELRLDAGS